MWQWQKSGGKENFQHCQNIASMICCQVNNKRGKLSFSSVFLPFFFFKDMGGTRRNM